jgi:hypothetical protein
MMVWSGSGPTRAGSGYVSVLRRTCLFGAVTSLAWLAQPALAADLVQEQAASEIRVTKDASGFHVNTVTRDYLYNSFVAATVDATTTAPLLRQILLIEKTSAMTEADHEDPDYQPSRIKVSVFPLTDKGQGQVQYTIAAAGEEVKADSSYLTITRPGCCVEYATKAVYSLETGKYLFNTTNDQWATLGAKGGFAMTRIAVANVAPTEADDELFAKTKHVGAILSYVSPTAPLQRFLVLLPPDAEDDVTLNWSGDLLWVSADYPEGTNHIYADRSDKPENIFTAATLRFKLDDTDVIDIPLQQDRLNPAAAKLPKGFALKELPAQ